MYLLREVERRMTRGNKEGRERDEEEEIRKEKVEEVING